MARSRQSRHYHTTTRGMMIVIMPQLLLVMVLLVGWMEASVSSSSSTSSTAHHVLLDDSGHWNLPRGNLYDDDNSSNPKNKKMIAIISSPGTISSSSLLVSSNHDTLSSSSSSALLTLHPLDDDDHSHHGGVVDQSSPIWLSCRGSSLCSTTIPERTSLATTSLVANVFVLEGVTAGDLQSSSSNNNNHNDHGCGLSNSRHARTLTALFRARLRYYHHHHQSTNPSDEDDNENNVRLSSSTSQQQSLIVCLPSIIMETKKNNEENASDDDNDNNKALSNSLLESVRKEIITIYDAVVAEGYERIPFDTLYRLHTVEGNNPEKVRALALQEAAVITTEPDEDDTPSELVPMSLTTLLSKAYQFVRSLSSSSSDLFMTGLDSPRMAHEYLKIRQSYAQQARLVRATAASWKSRTARGGWVSTGFGQQAEQLRNRVVQRFVQDTRQALGWNPASVVTATTSSTSGDKDEEDVTTTTSLPQYRYEVQQQLIKLVESVIRDAYQMQVTNVEKSTLKQLQDQLMKVYSSTSSSTNPITGNTNQDDSTLDTTNPNSNNPNLDQAAALRAAAFSFDTIMDGLEVQSLGLTKAKASRVMNVKLHDAIEAFPNSPRMQLKRLAEVRKTTNKENNRENGTSKRKQQQRAIDIGLDLVAMLRPDGFGSFQGFCGYQLGGNSITFGIHNDADDPQVIAQFGGVRPPLLRVQPKLRVDIDL